MYAASLWIHFFIKYCLYKNLFLLSSFRKWRRVLAYSFYKIIPSELPFYDCLAKPSSVICNPRSKLLTSTDNGTAVKLIIAAKGYRPFLHLLCTLRPLEFGHLNSGRSCFLQKCLHISAFVSVSSVQCFLKIIIFLKKSLYKQDKLNTACSTPLP